MPSERWKLWTHEGGERDPQWTGYTLLLLSGAPLEKIAEFMTAGFGLDDVPASWKQAAIQRYQEAEAHDPRIAKTGVVGVVGYWAEKLGVVELERNGDTTAWLVVSDGDA